MPTPEVWFAIPSANPEKCRKTLPVWRKMGYRIAVLQNFERGDIPADICVWRDEYPGWPGSVNILCREVVPKDCPIVVTGGDDMLPDPNHTAQQLAQQFLERFPDTFGVMQPHGDEFMLARLYCGSPFMGRAWFSGMYRGEGGMHAGYRHNWADNELYWLAKGLGALWERPDLSHHHEHFTRSGEDKPAYWKQNVETKDFDDCRLYINRSWSRFPGSEALTGPGASRRFDSSVLAQGAMHLAEIKMAMACYADGVRTNWLRAIAGGLDACAGAGLSPIALYGSGTHTRSVSEALMLSPARIDCIIDDNASRQGDALWNWPIVSPEEAIRRGVRAVVCSANAHEGAIWDNIGPLLDAGIRVLRLYPPSFAEQQTRVTRAIERCHGAGAQRIAITNVLPQDLAENSWLRDAVLSFTCIVSPEAAGSAFYGRPVVTQPDALSMGVDAVIDATRDRAPDERDPHVKAWTDEGVQLHWMYAPRNWSPKNAVTRARRSGAAATAAA